MACVLGVFLSSPRPPERGARREATSDNTSWEQCTYVSSTHLYASFHTFSTHLSSTHLSTHCVRGEIRTRYVGDTSEIVLGDTVKNTVEDGAKMGRVGGENV